MENDLKFMKRIRVFVFAVFSTLSASALVAEESIKDEVVIDETPLDRKLNGGVVSYSESLSKIRPAVVNISSTRVFDTQRQLPEDHPFWRFFGEGMPRQREIEGQGSGVVVSESGYILTNNHVVENASEVSVSFQDGRILDAKVIGADPQTDLAVLKVDGDEEFPFAVMADSEQIEVGDVVFAIGNPLGVGQTVTMGIVSAKGRNDLNMIRDGFENFIQTDASINQGNSGGALVDAQGRLIGINTMILTDGRSTGNIGIGFSIPTALAHAVMVSLIEDGSVSRGFLGVAIQSLDKDLVEAMDLEDSKGALVTNVVPDSPAEEAGLKVGDLIVKVGDEEVASDTDLRLKIASKAPDSLVDLTVYRDEKYFKTEAKLVERRTNGRMTIGSRTRELLDGVEAEPVSDDLRRQFQIDETVENGLVITSVSPDSPYARQLMAGMVIEKIKDERVYTVAEAKDLLESGEKVALFVYIDGFYRYMAIDVE
ncbi:MAG TPA: protease Do [Opitutae bacterium]|nr:protease Do [Opitutaceae bacterium]HCR28776.1 protease Do [Opitutae bacterium]